jgi:hypothetical protein
MNIVPSFPHLGKARRTRDTSGTLINPDADGWPKFFRAFRHFRFNIFEYQPKNFFGFLSRSKMPECRTFLHPVSPILERRKADAGNSRIPELD